MGCESREWSGSTCRRRRWMWRSGRVARSSGCRTRRRVRGAGGARLRRLGKAQRPELVVVEATGGLERGVVAALDAARVAVAVVNPRQVRDFARCLGRLAKTDRLDAQVLARYGEAVGPEPRPGRMRPRGRRRAWWPAVGNSSRCSRWRRTGSTRRRPDPARIRRHLEFLEGELAEVERPARATRSRPTRPGRRPIDRLHDGHRDRPGHRHPAGRRAARSWARWTASRSPRWSASPRSTATAAPCAANAPAGAAGQPSAPASTWPPAPPSAPTRPSAPSTPASSPPASSNASPSSPASASS